MYKFMITCSVDSYLISLPSSYMDILYGALQTRLWNLYQQDVYQPARIPAKQTKWLLDEYRLLLLFWHEKHWHSKGILHHW